MKGATLFQKIKELRETTEKMYDFQTSLREEAQEVPSDSSSVMMISGSSITDLLCDILPVLSKSHPGMLSASVDEIVKIPWMSTALQQGDESLEDVDMADVPDLSQMESVDGTKQIDVSINHAPKSKRLVRSSEVKEEEQDEDEIEDEIEEFD